MADKIIPDDLRNTTSDKKTNDYFLVTVNDLNPAENYNFQFRWAYEDKTTSEWSSTFSTFTVSEGTPNTPKFVSGNLVGGNGFVKLTWTGLNSLDGTMVGLKQVNVWIKGGTYGSEFVNSGQFFTEAGTKTITLPIGEYFFKLQAQTALGSLSLFSSIQSARSFKSPTAISSLSGTWLKDDGTTKTDTLKVSFTYDSTFSDSTNSNLDINHFIVKLTNSGRSRSFILAVNKTSSSQAFYLSRELNIATFGLFAGGFTMSVTAVDSFGNLSAVTTETSSDYVTPLDTPVITLTPGILSYSVSWNSQSGKPLDQIYIEEVESSSNTAPSTGYTQVAQGNQNPLNVNTLNSNKRWVRAKFYDSTGNATTYGTAQHVTPYAAVTADTEGPSDVISVTTTAGIDTSGYLGFNGYIDVSWPSVTGGGIRGYRIRFSNDGGTTYSYVDSPGTGTTYRLGGLAIGSTYKIAVATYDEFNNTSTNYISATDRLIPGTPSMSNYISAGNMKLGYGISGANDKGLYLDSSNYWYLNAANSARLNIGGSTSNYLNWNGSEFAIDGNLIAQKGTFKGNVSIASGGSLYSGTIVSGEISGTGYILNTSGLSFYQNSTEKTVINASTGKLTTVSANIGGWDVDSTTISKNGISLNSSGTIIANNSAYYVGIRPQVSSANDIVLWAGQSATGGSVASGANFRVTAGGNLYATGAVISGALVIESGSTFDEIALAKLEAAAAKAAADLALQPEDLNAAAIIQKVNAAQGSSEATYIIGGAVSTGLLISTLYGQNPLSGGVGSDFSNNGLAISLDDGAMSSKNFYINNDGDAFFKGTITASNIDATSKISGAEIVGSVFKTSATANKTDRPASGVYIDDTGIYGYGTNVGTGEELFKLTAGMLTTKSAVIGPLTLANGAITSTQFNIDSNGNALFSGTLRTGAVGSTRIEIDSAASNTIKFFEGTSSNGYSINVTSASFQLDSPGGGTFAINTSSSSSFQSGFLIRGDSYGRIGSSVAGLFLYPNKTTTTGFVSLSETDGVSIGISPSNASNLKEVRFTTTDAQPSGGKQGDIVLVYSV
jgi:hypothetical protein